MGKKFVYKEKPKKGKVYGASTSKTEPLTPASQHVLRRQREMQSTRDKK